jgi:hypothetical protein
MAEIREKRLVAALRKRAVTLLARALRKAPGDPDKFTSQLSCSLLLETNLASFRARPNYPRTREARRGSAYSLKGKLWKGEDRTTRPKREGQRPGSR